jgi:hypothetical protein
VLVDHNTLFAGGTSQGSAAALSVVFDSLDSNPTRTLQITDNILAGNNTSSTGLVLGQCNGELIQLDNNLFLNQYPNVAALASPCSPSSFATLADLETAVNSQGISGVASNNLTFLSGCNADPTHCITRSPCGIGAADEGPCLQDLLVSWDVSTHGYSDLLGLSGWNLSPNPNPPGLPSCRVTEGYDDNSGSFPFNVDIFGNPRGSTPSVGAVEFEGPCCP